MNQTNRVFSIKFKIDVAKKILAGASVSEMSEKYGIRRNVLYRWRDAYRSDGAAGLDRPVGRPPGHHPPSPTPATAGSAALAFRVAQLERKAKEQAHLLTRVEKTLARIKGALL
ncbi:MAG: transposase [Bryobacteraceae bacterium]